MIRQSNNNSIPLSSPSADSMNELRKEYEKLPLFKRILSGFSFLNKQSRLFNRSMQEIKLQIESRDSDWKLEWSTPEDLQIVEKICELACLFDWPAIRFIPDDPLYLIYLTDFDEMAEVDLDLHCDQEFGVSMDDFFWNFNRETTLNDLVIAIKQAQAINTDSQ